MIITNKILDLFKQKETIWRNEGTKTNCMLIRIQSFFTDFDNLNYTYFGSPASLQIKIIDRPLNPR